jgi:hypothetical protein
MIPDKSRHAIAFRDELADEFAAGAEAKTEVPANRIAYRKSWNTAADGMFKIEQTRSPSDWQNPQVLIRRHAEF